MILDTRERESVCGGALDKDGVSFKYCTFILNWMHQPFLVVHFSFETRGLCDFRIFTVCSFLNFILQILGSFYFSRSHAICFCVHWFA